MTDETLKRRITWVDSIEFAEFMQEFAKESDRAAVILGAAKLDLLLYQLLLKFFLPNTSRTDDLFDGDAPLSSFSAKIHLSYRLGLIDAELARALHLIRKIRNDFAHEASGCSLNSGAHRNRVKELIMAFAYNKTFTDSRKYFFKDEKGPSENFRTMLAFIYLSLSVHLHWISTLKSVSPAKLSPFSEEKKQ